MDLELARPRTAPISPALVCRDDRAPASATEVAVAPPLAEIRTALRERLSGIGLVADLALAPIDHLFDDERSALRFSREPVCYYGNHQTSYESFLISYLHLAIAGTPLLVVTHPGLFDNDYGEHCMLLAERLMRCGHPAANSIQVVAVPHELKKAREFLLNLPKLLEGRSLLVHVGAWRELSEGQEVNTMSKDLMEVTMRLGRSVVPLRISGGLPSRSLGYKFHLPYRMSPLTVTMAPTLEFEELKTLNGAGQRERILRAINAMAPPAGTYAGTPNSALAKRCLRRHVESGSSALKCFLLEALETMPDPSWETRLLRKFIRYGVLPVDGIGDTEWFARKAMWISDGRGLKTV